MADAFGAINHKSLVCTNIPELFLDKYVARTHFSRFGQLVNFVLRPRRMCCTVSYATEAEAALALREGRVYNGHEFNISYAEIEKGYAQKTEEWVDPDVQAELSVLSGNWRNEPSSSQQQQQGNSGALNGSKSSFGSALAKANLMPNSSSKSSNQRERAHPQNMSAKLELEAVMRKPAHTTEEKYRVLDARDKLLRLSQRPTTDINRASATHGYCPDMCPEKERLLREFQRQVAIMELAPHTDDIIDHKLAIKQYSRSSADQEAPLPHELRSEEALHMTMAYMMHEVMDRCEAPSTHPIGDWFHFVWDRTRSIRKEITQQELCSLGAVKLVEQCARFHIHCAARLVAEDPSVFDSKINAENLTKCLQTLKYMYHDLRLKGIQCPCEAEFRGYIVLLNLADANFLWDIGQLPIQLQSCREIRQAIKFYLALQDTNIVRFFQLLRDAETSYLSACILVTYFTSLRTLAVRRLLKAYRSPRDKEVSTLPLSYLTEMLGFPSEMEAMEFVETLGLTVTENYRVTLQNISHAKPMEFKLKRQLELVESKRTQTVGECVCGEPLPPQSIYKNHRPHNSFTEQGYLKSSAWSAKDQMSRNSSPEMSKAPEMDLPKPVQQPERRSPVDSVFKMPLRSAPISPKLAKSPTTLQPPLFKQLPAPPVTQLTSQPMHSAFLPVAQPTTNAASTSFFGQVKPPSQQQLQSQPGLFNSFTPIRSSFGGPSVEAAAAAEAAAKEKQQQEEIERRQKQEKEEALRAVEKALAEAKRREAELLEQRKEQEAKRLKAEQLQRERDQQQKQKLDKQMHIMLNNLLDAEVAQVCAQEVRLINSAKAIYAKQLNSLIRQVIKDEFNHSSKQLLLMRRYWHKWRNYRRIQQAKNQLLYKTPVHFGVVDVNRLVPSDPDEGPLQLMRRYRLGEPIDYRSLLDGLEDELWMKLDLWKLLSKVLNAKYHHSSIKFFKLLLSLPECGKLNERFEFVLERGVLDKPLSSSQKGNRENSNSPCYINALAENVALCVRKLIGHSLINERKTPATLTELSNADGVILCLSTSQLDEARQRLDRICRLGNPYLAIIVENDDPTLSQSGTPLTTILAVELQLERRNLLAYKIYSCSNASPNRPMSATAFISVLHRATGFLADLPHPSRSQLVQTELREWLIGNLGTELFNRFRHACQQDGSIGESCRRDPQFCVRLYNEAVRRIRSVATENLQSYPQLPVELRHFVEPLPKNVSTLPNQLEYFSEGWQTPGYRKQLEELLTEAQLPHLPPIPVSSTDKELCEWVLAYAQSTQDEPLVETLAIHAVQALSHILQNPSRADYLSLIEIFAKERLQFVLRQKQQLPVAIVYHRQTMRDCFDSQWYYEWHKPAPPKSTSPAAPAELPRELPEQRKLPSPGGRVSVEPVDPATFDEVVAHAQALLDRCQRRREHRFLDHNLENCDPLKNSSPRNLEMDLQTDSDKLLDYSLELSPPEPKRQRKNPMSNPPDNSPSETDPSKQLKIFYRSRKFFK